MEKYYDRVAAGQVLATYLTQYANQKDTIILALPRGGVPVAYEIAKKLHLPLDVFIVRKLGVPGHEELAMGALASGGVIVFNDSILVDLHISQQAVNQVIQKEQQELDRREISYRGKRPFPELKNKKIILVDDGIATGATMRAAIKALREFNPKKIIIAVPVAEVSTCEAMEKIADAVVCPMRPEFFYAVGLWYENFGQTTDEEVSQLLNS